MAEFVYSITNNIRYATTKTGIPDSNAHGANMGPTWSRQVPGGTHVGHMKIVIWDV